MHVPAMSSGADGVAGATDEGMLRAKKFVNHRSCFAGACGPATTSSN